MRVVTRPWAASCACTPGTLSSSSFSSFCGASPSPWLLSPVPTFLCSFPLSLLRRMAVNGTSATSGAVRTPQGSPLPCKLIGLDGAVTLLEILDHGSYGKVFLAKTMEGKQRAAKCVPLRIGTHGTSSTDESTETEAGIMKLVKHRNVIRLHDSKILDGRLWVRKKLSMEYARYGNVRTYLESDGRKILTEGELAVVAKSMLSALKRIHKRGVMHRDVKPSNILVTSDGTVKLGDLGTACLAQSSTQHSVQGTFQYLAPEIFGDQSYDGKVDLWALGMTLLELAQGFNPFQSEHFARVLYHLVDAPCAPALADPSRHSASFIDFLSHLLTLKPSDRSPAATLLKHAFLKKAAPQLPLKRRQGGLSASAQLLASGRSPISSSSSSSPASSSTSSSPLNSMNSMPATDSEDGSSSLPCSSPQTPNSLSLSCSDDSEEFTPSRPSLPPQSPAARIIAITKSPVRARPLHPSSHTANNPNSNSSLPVSHVVLA